MIIEFTVGNFRSIAEPQTLSMVAADIASENDNGIINAGDMKLLRVAAIYGANASGKSNFWQALKVFVQLAQRSAVKYQEGDKLPIEPFMLKAEQDKAPTFFEIVFLLEGETFRYGCEVSAERIESEWLFVKKTTRETRLFTRDLQDIDVNPRAFPEGKDKTDLTRENAFFLSVVAQWNGELSRKIVHYLKNINTLDGSIKSAFEEELYTGFTTFCLKTKYFKEMVTAFLRQLDLSLNKLEFRKPPEGYQNILGEENPQSPILTGETVHTLHPIYDDKGVMIGERTLDLKVNGSAGTQKIYALAGYIIDTLAHGDVLYVDELETQLHPLMTRAIINLFNSPQTNPNNAQLIFNTHDTNLLKPDLLRRDQIWFTEKDRFGATHLYSLAEFRQEDGTLPRKDADFEEHYIQGRYGAIPYLGDFSDLITPKMPEPKETKAKTAALPKKTIKAKTVKPAGSPKKATKPKAAKPAAKKTARKKAVKNG